MSNVPAGLKYSKEHEWVKMEGNVALVGITDHAQAQLGDIVFCELPKVGKDVAFMKPFGVVESVKAASDVYSPLSGKVVAVNEQLSRSPETINQDPFGKGWMLKIELSKPDELNQLMDDKGYTALISKK
jgi:glycine cleavage system H protein